MKSKVGTTLSFAIAIAAMLITARVADAAPTRVNFTGRLATTAGPVSGSIGMTFKLFAEPTGGTALWSEAQSASADGGLVYAELGSQSPLDPGVFATNRVFLEVAIGDETLSPRLTINSVPYAISASKADTAATLGTIGPDDVLTAISGTAGITASKTGNSVSVGLTTSGCQNRDTLKFDGATWACGPEATFTAGTGLALDAGQLAVAPNGITMSRVSFPSDTGSSSAILSTSGTIAPVTAFAPEGDGNCLIHAFLSTSESTPSGTVTLRVTNNGNLFGSTQGLVNTTGSTTMTAQMTSLAPVVAGISTQFGCGVTISSGSAFEGNTFSCRITYVCF